MPEIKEIKVQCPAKINLDLKIVGCRPDGFHNIESTMQTISLYDFLTIRIKEASETEVFLSGNSEEIPYNEKNIVYKAIIEFLSMAQKCAKVEVYIDKNIPVAAGLAGGSTDAAGVILALNKFYANLLENSQLHEICAKLGSDLNFCLEGGCKKATSRGEILTDAPFVERNISLIKPINIGISAKEAYTQFANKIDDGTRQNFINDLEWALIDVYEELKTIKQLYPNSIMTGSGSTFFAFDTEFQPQNDFWIANNLKTINTGAVILR